MKTFVVDTDVASFLFRQHPLVTPYRVALAGHDLVLSFMSVAELEEWPLRNHWGWPRRRRLAQFIGAHRIVYANRELCRLFAQARTELLGQGTPVETRDVWIASTALLLGAPLVTNNARHFHRFGKLALFTLP